MDAASQNRVQEVLAELVRGALARREEVEIPGLGSLKIVHRSSEIDETPEGQLRMRPPRDDVVFEPGT